jgi:hypothetical protein
VGAALPGVRPRAPTRAHSRGRWMERRDALCGEQACRGTNGDRHGPAARAAHGGAALRGDVRPATVGVQPLHRCRLDLLHPPAQRPGAHRLRGWAPDTRLRLRGGHRSRQPPRHGARRGRLAGAERGSGRAGVGARPDRADRPGLRPRAPIPPDR